MIIDRYQQTKYSAAPTSSERAGQGLQIHAHLHLLVVTVVFTKTRTIDLDLCENRESTIVLLIRLEQS